jgi:hypothetical protein
VQHVVEPALKDDSAAALARAWRHFFASVLIDAGESASAVAGYLGHSDPGFTLRVYAHLFRAATPAPGAPSTQHFSRLRQPTPHRIRPTESAGSTPLRDPLGPRS